MDEVAVGIRVAVVLLIVGFIITVVFAILGFMKALASQGLTEVQNQLDALSASRLDDYDQSVHSGTRVMSTIKAYDGLPFTIVVRTTAVTTKPAYATYQGFVYGAYVSANITTPAAPTANVNGQTGTFSVPLLTKNTGESWYTAALVTTSGSYTWNRNVLPARTQGQDPFVRPNGKFLAEHIKDSNGDVIGICFTQQ